MPCERGDGNRCVLLLLGMEVVRLMVEGGGSGNAESGCTIAVYDVGVLGW